MAEIDRHVVRIEPGAPDTLQMHREVAGYTFSVLWAGKWLIAGMVVVCVLAAAGVLVMLPPQYTSEAVIQLNFDQREPADRAHVGPIATLDPVALMNGEIQVIRSERTASAVVTRLGLARDSNFTLPSAFAVALHRLQSAVGAVPATPTPHDRAVAALMRKIQVQNQPNSYLIAIAVTSANPSEAQVLANAVAEEYLRGTELRNLMREKADAQAEIAALAGQFGSRHPSLRRASQRLARLTSNLDRLRNARSSADILALGGGGPGFIPADKSSIPSGPKARLLLAAAGVVGAAGGMFLALRRQRRGGAVPGAADDSDGAAYRPLRERQVISP